MRALQGFMVAALLQATVLPAGATPPVPSLPAPMVDSRMPLLVAVELTANEQAVFDKVQAIIVDLLGVSPDQVTPDARFAADLGADELDMLELTIETEDALGMTMDDTEVESVVTVRDFVVLVAGSK